MKTPQDRLTELAGLVERACEELDDAACCLPLTRDDQIAWSFGEWPLDTAIRYSDGDCAAGVMDACFADLIVATLNQLPDLLSDIAAMKARIEALETGLMPFAAVGEMLTEGFGPALFKPDEQFKGPVSITKAESTWTLLNSDLIAARTLLSGEGE